MTDGHAIERMAPLHHLSAPYYERVLTAAAILLVENRIVAARELGDLIEGTFPLSKPIGPGRQNAPEQTFIIGETVQVTEEPTYDVRFRSTELWPDSADEAFIHIGVFQSYLEKVG